MQAKVLLSFTRQPDPDYQVKVSVIISSMTDNPHYPEPWPAPVPPLARIVTAAATFNQAYIAALTHDSNKIRARNEARETLTEMLKLLAAYVELVANGNIAILASSGFDLRQDTGPRTTSTAVLPAPTELRVTHGNVSGTLDAQLARVPNAVSYELQYTQGDPLVEANWKHGTTSASSDHIPLGGLTVAQNYWLRGRAIGKGISNFGLWSAPVSIIVV